MKWVGWISFFLVVIGLAVGGFFLVSKFDKDTFQFKEVEILDYGDYSLNDFVEQDVICNDKICTFKDKDVDFTISEVKELGKQDVTLKLEYEGENFEKTFHVDVVDQKNPEIILNESAIILDLNEKIDAVSYVAEVKDNYDTLSVDDIEIDNNVNLKKAGDYEIVYTIKDSSGNQGKAILKVKVKGEREIISSNDSKKEEVVEKITLNYSISGLFSDSANIIEGNNPSIANKNIEFNWDNTLQGTASINSDGKIGLIISKEKITGNETSLSNSLPQVKSKKVSKGETVSFQYTFDEEGTYYVSIMVWNDDNKVIIRKDYCLNITNPSEVKDMKLITEDHGTYLTIDCAFIGGPDSLYFDAAISDSNDPNIEEAFVYENDEIRLYYKAGYYYEILGALFDEDENIVIAKTLKIQK